MSYSRMLLLAIVLACVALSVINYRTPIFNAKAGKWSVGYGSSPSFLADIPINRNPLISPENLSVFTKSTEFLADPFFIRSNDTQYIFFEHKRYNSHGVIGLLKCHENKFEFAGDIISEKFHMSYPHVFKHKGEFYMLPETQVAGHVLLYKATNFPDKWEICDTLIPNLKLKDPTIFLSDTLNILVGSDKDLKMYMYRADSLFGKWTAHPKPIVMMGTESRPGGRFIPDGKDLILPVQNASKGYGTGVSLYRMRFNKDDYSVERIHKFYLQGIDSIPEFTYGMHHIDYQKIGNRNHYVYDGMRILSDEKTFKYRAAFKMTMYDVRNWFYQKFN